MTDTLFQKIIRKEIPCHRVYEDEHVLAFLDIHPLSPGHTLLIPKEPAVTLDQLSETTAAALGKALPKLCKAIVQATGITEYNVLQNNGSGAHQAVMHVHFHIIPKPSSSQGLHIGWPASALKEGAAMAESIAQNLA
jgi:histidine triad (HIT) family protein